MYHLLNRKIYIYISISLFILIIQNYELVNDIFNIYK